MFGNMKVGTRLALGFASVIVLLLTVLAVGMQRMSAIDTRLHEITDESFVALNQSGHAAERSGF